MEESLRHRNILSQARRLYTNIDMFEPLVQVKSILNSKHVGPEAQILYDYIIAFARENVSNYTRKIEADPEDAESYLHRARYYHCLDDKVSALADMDKYVGIYYPTEGMDSHGLSFRS